MLVQIYIYILVVCKDSAHAIRCVQRQMMFRRVFGRLAWPAGARGRRAVPRACGIGLRCCSLVLGIRGGALETPRGLERGLASLASPRVGGRCGCSRRGRVRGSRSEVCSGRPRAKAAATAMALKHDPVHRKGDGGAGRLKDGLCDMLDNVSV